MIKLNKQKCKYLSSDHCGGALKCECAEICPVDAFICGDELHIDEEKCIECGACMAVCSQEAIKIE